MGNQMNLFLYQIGPFSLPPLERKYCYGRDEYGGLRFLHGRPSDFPNEVFL